MQHGPAASSGSNPKAPGSAGGYLLFLKAIVCGFFLNLLSIEDQLQKILLHRRCNKGADQFTNAHVPDLSLDR